MRLAVWIAITAIVGGTSASAQSLAEQAQCTAQAKRTFQEQAANSTELNELGMHMHTISFDYQSHYNTKINRCLILTTKSFGVAGESEISISKNLYDAFERRDYDHILMDFAQRCKILGRSANILPINSQLRTNKIL